MMNNAQTDDEGPLPSLLGRLARCTTGAGSGATRTRLAVSLVRSLASRAALTDDQQHLYAFQTNFSYQYTGCV